MSTLLFPFLSLGPLFKSSLLLLNAVAVLSEDRFLARIGWSRSSYLEAQAQSFGGPGGGIGGGVGGSQDVKSKVVEGIHMVIRAFRMPLIVVNVVLIVWEMLLG